jgi:hypothetical protein
MIVSPAMEKPIFDDSKEFIGYWRGELQGCNRGIRNFTNKVLLNVSASCFMPFSERWQMSEYATTNTLILRHMHKYEDIIDGIVGAFPDHNFQFTCRDEHSRFKTENDLHTIRLITPSEYDIAEIRMTLFWNSNGSNNTNDISINVAKRFKGKTVKLHGEDITPYVRTVFMQSCGGHQLKQPPKPDAIVQSIKYMIKTMDKFEEESK